MVADAYYNMNGIASAPMGQLAQNRPEVPKVGDIIKLVFNQFGDISQFPEGYNLQPQDKLVEVEVKSVKKVKVEYEEA